MGIYIKGMEMPKDGVYWCEIGVADDIAMITIHGEDRKSFPLVPVPPHGRLIDGDYAEKDLTHDYAYAAAQMVKNYPTIIPAEESNI
jgi:hypothetical protein